MFEQWLFLLSYPIAYIILRQIYIVFKRDEVVRFIGVLLLFFIIPWVNIAVLSFILMWELAIRERTNHLESFFIQILDNFFFVRGDGK